MAARLGGPGYGRDIATHYSVRSGAVGQPPVHSVGLGRAVSPPQQPSLTISDVLCCPCKIISLVFIYIFRRNLAATFFYTGVVLSGVGFGTVTYILCFKVDSVFCYVNLAKMVGRYVITNVQTHTQIFHHIIIKVIFSQRQILAIMDFFILLQIDWRHLCLHGLSLL